MRADRLLSILLLLQNHIRLTGRELAHRLEVSERTIHRDMEALSTAGVPVMAERGAGGGWSLLESYRTNLTGLNLSEVQALFVAAPSHLMADLGLRQASETALIKLLASLPGDRSRHDAAFMRERIHIDGAGWQQEPEQVVWLPLVQEALWQERQIKLNYQRNDDSVVERVVDPLGLVAKGRIWYLVAAVEGQTRTYRVSRIQSAELMHDSAFRPANFDLAAFWRESMSDFKANLPRYCTTFYVDPAILPEMRYMGHIEFVHPAGEDGWQAVEMRFDVELQARAFALGFGGQLKVLAPPELRETVLRLAHAALRCHDMDSATHD
ncbi:MAG: YafY family transcriptional regulator [Chloroflexi bacterium]|nr:YafY family transcriptional regulator [Chloroflexota bacterium]